MKRKVIVAVEVANDRLCARECPHMDVDWCQLFGDLEYDPVKVDDYGLAMIRRHRRCVAAERRAARLCSFAFVTPRGA